jgi:hypothetical protein
LGLWPRLDAIQAGSGLFQKGDQGCGIGRIGQPAEAIQRGGEVGQGGGIKATVRG